MQAFLISGQKMALTPKAAVLFSIIRSSLIRKPDSSSTRISPRCGQVATDANPTKTHRFIRNLRDAGKLVRHYTQNIDCLEEKAGLSTDVRTGLENAECVFLHGSLHRFRCSNCGVDLMSMFRAAAEEKTLAAFHIGHLLAATAKSQAEDPRDKVFALSGLLSDHALPESLLDYTKSAGEVFMETAKIVLEQERDPYALFGFAGVGWHSNLRDLPSWLVDWSRSQMPIPFWEGVYVDYLKGQGERQRPLPGRRRPRIRMHTVGTPRLFARGTIVDRVAKDVEAVGPSGMGEATATSLQHSRDRSDWYLKARNLLDQDQDTYPHTGQPLEEAFWRTIVADRSGLARPAPAYFEACNRIYEKLSRVRVRVYGATPKEPLRIGDYPELRDIWPTELGAEAQLMEFMHAIPRSTENRKFIVGERGFLGLAPPLSKVGDLICLLDGGPTPFILREQEGESGLFAGCYHLVGECYVHGLRADVDVEQGSTTFVIT